MRAAKPATSPVENVRYEWDRWESGRLTESANDDIDDEMASRYEEFPDVQKSQDEEDSHSNGCPSKRGNIAVHLPVEFWMAGWVRHTERGG